jgi:antitoxin (DNA-binding transcriptional repressor) of toxin-antitoxin stability system
MPGSRLVRVARGIPVARLIAIGELLLLAREHITRLEPEERRRVVELVRRGARPRGRLSGRERRELEALIAKAEPRLFAREAVRKFSPIRR